MTIRIILLTIFLLTNVFPTFAHPQYLEIYDNDSRSLSSWHNRCDLCHISSIGGGPRNKFGVAFQEAGFMISDSLVEQFPNLFKSSSPNISRTKPTTFKTNIESMIIVRGNNFTNESVVFIDNTTTATTFQSSIKLLVNFIFTAKGSHNLKVKNPDGTESNNVKILAK